MTDPSSREPREDACSRCGQSHTKFQRCNLEAALERSEQAREEVEKKAAFWEGRHNTQHRTLHSLEDKLEAAEKALRFIAHSHDNSPSQYTPAHAKSCENVAREALSLLEE